MIKPEQIPDEVVEAAARVLAACHSTEANWEIFLPRARAAIAAALNAWPGMEIEMVFVEEDYLILPLRKENTND